MKSKHFFSWLLIATLFLTPTTFSSCVTPKYSQTAVDGTKNALAQTDAMYSSADRAYHAEKYAAINTEIENLKELYATRKHNKRLVDIINRIDARFDGYETQHKSLGVLNESQAQRDKGGMAVLWKELYGMETKLNK